MVHFLIIHQTTLRIGLHFHMFGILRQNTSKLLGTFYLLFIFNWNIKLIAMKEIWNSHIISHSFEYSLEYHFCSPEITCTIKDDSDQVISALQNLLGNNVTAKSRKLYQSEYQFRLLFGGITCTSHWFGSLHQCFFSMILFPRLQVTEYRWKYHLNWDILILSLGSLEFKLKNSKLWAGL